MSPASTRRRETTAGKASLLSIGSSSPGPVRRAEPVGCVPERLHLFPREEGCRGRHGEAAILTPDAVVVVAEAWRLEFIPRIALGYFTLKAFLLYPPHAILMRLSGRDSYVVILIPETACEKCARQRVSYNRIEERKGPVPH